MTDREIQQKCELTSLDRQNGAKPLIAPFISYSCSTLPDGRKGPSYGLSSFGYDIRLSHTFDIHNPRAIEHDSGHLVPPNDDSDEIQYKLAGQINPYRMKLPCTQGIIDFANQASNIEDGAFTRFSNVEWIDIPPLGFALAASMEYFNIPSNSKGICMGKSTVARNAIHVFVTPLEPEWSGYLTLEIFNSTRSPARLYAGMGITQIMFVADNTNPETTYADRTGKYQYQPELPVRAMSK